MILYHASDASNKKSIESGLQPNSYLSISFELAVNFALDKRNPMIFVFNIDSESLINPEELCYDDEILNKNIIYPIYTMMPMIPFPKNWYELNDNLDRLHPELFDEANWKIINNCNC